MSLRIWLPLNGTLDNQGLDVKLISQVGTGISITDGKIGKCFQFPNNCASYIHMPGFNLQTGSWAAWIKVLGGGSASRQCLMSLGRDSYNDGVEFYTNQNGTTLSFKAHKITLSTSIELNKWYHVVGTFGDNLIKLYINGILIKSESYTEDMTYEYSNNRFVLGKMSFNYTNAASYFPYNGCLNDVRIYNHALSPLEVKEISKGLILHYPLNRNGWGQENLVWNSNWNVHSTTPPESWVNWGSPPTKEIVTIDGKNWLHVISNTGRFQGYSQNWTKRNGVGELTANTKITVSFTAKLATAASIAPIGIHWCNSSGTIITQNWTTTALTTSPERYSFTYTTPADCVAFNIMVGDDTNTAHEVWITDIKLEFGEIATPWCPNSSDTLATIMGLNDIVEYDTSGYCNNGIRKGTSRFSWTSDTPKYNVSQIFSGIHRIEAPFNPGNSPTFTVAGWFYHTGGTTYYGAKNSYNTFICLEGGRYFVYNNTGSAYVGYWTSTANTWQHVVLVHDAVTTKLKLYINGNFVSEVTTNGTIYGSDILDIGGRQGAALYRGKMSDFRIYATALSADDIKSLYNNSAYIDNQGNIYGAVYEEV